MEFLSSELASIRDEFLVLYNNCEPIINEFYEDMKKKNNLMMLNTYVFCNNSIKSGEYLALDFGGSNIRISLYELKSELILKKSRSFSLRGDNFDYTTEKYSLIDIFEMIVDKIEEIIEPGKEYLLGHTFSFAMNSISKNTATIIELSKGFKLKNTINKDINKTLKEVIDKRGLSINPVAVINDTTATLLSGYMVNRDTNMGCIIGTGHNMCFINDNGEIINIESGSFNSHVIPLTKYDKEFLKKLPDESQYLMEVLIGGKNSTKLVKEVVDCISDKGLINPILSITPTMLSMVIDNDLVELDKSQNYVLREIAKIIYLRSAYLVACEILGVLKYLNANNGVFNVVFDGTVYEKTPYFGKCLTDVLNKLLPDEIKVTHMLTKDGSSRGAVLACAM